MTESEKQLYVRFVAKPGVPGVLDVPTTPFAVPISMKRKGLGDLINTLLNLVPARKFTFYVDGDRLKGSIGAIAKKKSVSEEAVLDVEYAEVKPKPMPEVVCEHDDWVSSVDASADGVVLSGSYDCFLRLWGVPSGDRMGSAALHEQPIKSCIWLNNVDYRGHMHAISCSKDHTVRSYLVDKESGTIEPMQLYIAHTDSVECIAGDPTGAKFCSGSWDNTVNVWHLARGEEKRGKKRRKKEVVTENAPIITLRGHSQAISSLIWSEESNIWTSSWDHSIRQWDVTSGTCISTLASSKAASVVASIASSGSQIASGHADRVIRLWDSKSDVLVQSELKGHEGWVTGVKYHPNDSNILASVGHDGHLKVWDTRKTESMLWSPGAVHSDKALCLSWCKVDGEWCIATGGCDNRLVVTKVTH